MKKTKYRFSRIALTVFVLLFLTCSFCFAEVPHLINYQGKLTDSEGVPLNGAYDLTFRIYDAETAGQLLWEEPHTGVVIQKGVFSVSLGSVTNLNLPFDKPYFLEIKVGNEVMSPRQQITSVGYAIRAEVAEITNSLNIPAQQGDILYYNGSTWTKLGAGTPGQYLKTQGSGANPQWTTMNGGRQLFTSSGIFTVPSGVTKVYLTMIAGGGGGGSGNSTSPYGYGGGGGGSGGAVIKYPFTVVGGNNYSVVVGAGGAGGVYGTGGTGGTGGVSSFSSLLVNGGSGGAISGGSPGVGGAGGSSPSAEFSKGIDGVSANAGKGAGGYMGTGGSGNPSGNGSPGTNYGAGGGGGGVSTTYVGGVGTAGFVLVEW